MPPSPSSSTDALVDLPDAESVFSYLRNLKQAIRLSDDPLGLLFGSEVLRIRLPKEKTIAQHEYVLALVKIKSKNYVFRMERTRGTFSLHTIEELKASEDREMAKLGEEFDSIVHDASSTTTPSTTTPSSTTAAPTAVPSDSIVHDAAPPSSTATSTPSSTTAAPTAVPSDSIVHDVAPPSSTATSTRSTTPSSTTAPTAVPSPPSRMNSNREVT